MTAKIEFRHDPLMIAEECLRAGDLFMRYVGSVLVLAIRTTGSSNVNVGGENSGRFFVLAPGELVIPVDAKISVVPATPKEDP